MTHFGSSPLTRGKRVKGPTEGDDARLIPAHAGKTTSRRSNRAASAAHPRSRGENNPMYFLVHNLLGSSPLTRGKRR